MEHKEPTEPSITLKRTAARRLLALWLRGATELLLYAPAWLAPAVYGIGSLPGQLLWLLHLPLLTLLGAALAYPIRRNWLRWMTSGAVGAAEIALLAPAAWWQAALLAAGGGASVLRGMAVTSAESRSSDVPRYGLGVAIYALCGLICSRLPEWAGYMPWLTAAGVVSLAITLFTWNRRLLQRETLSAEVRAVPAAARGHNRLMVSAMLVLSVSVTALASGAVGQLLFRAVRGLLRFLLSARSDKPVQPPPGRTPPTPQLPPPAEAGWLARVLDALVYIVGAASIVAVLALIVRAVYRHRREIARRLRQLLARVATLLGRTSRPVNDAGYVDEERGIWSWELVESAMKRRWRRFAGRDSNGRWSDLRDNRERVRYLYRQWLGRLRDAGYAAPGHLTPDEIRRDAADWESRAAANRRRPHRAGSRQADHLVELYYEARYGDGDIEDGDVERLRRQGRDESQ